MALKVWLPLDGDLHNQGLSNVTITNGGATVNASGNIGSCYGFNGSQYITIVSTDVQNIFQNTASSFSMACWIYLNSDETDRVIIFGNYIANPFINWELGANCTQRLCAGGTSNFTTKVNSTAVPKEKWTHIAVTYDGNITNFYMNGLLTGTETGANTITTKTASSTFWLGSDSRSGATRLKGRLNDFRLYNTALSAKEISEIAKGLVLHYPLSDRYNTSNIIYNGFGEHGTDGWADTRISTSDLPSDSSVKAAFTGGNTTERVIINPNNTFTLSCYVKSTGATSGSTYPSIMPYDIDGKFISHHHCRDGFREAWQSTLTQPLNKGDTVVHCSDLSSWSTSTSDNFYFIAVFGYKDSYGNTYPDFQYTQDSLSFGSKSDRSRLNKSNNTITLLQPYSGEPRPVGTKVCQSSAGNSYCYPFGSIALSSIQNWTHKNITLNFNNVNRLRYAKTIRWLNWQGALYAGIKITDNTWETSTVYDVSGYGHNGITTGTLTYSSDTPRYHASTHFTGTSYISTASPSTEVRTASLWAKWDTIPSGQSVVFLDYQSKLGLGLMSTGILCGTSGPGNYYTFSKSGIVANTWYHFVVVNDGEVTGTSRKLYINGVEQTPTTNKSNWSYEINQTQIGKRSTTNDGFVGQLSDLRFYSTSLSADQVKQLYDTPISLANNGTLFANQLVEG